MASSMPNSSQLGIGENELPPRGLFFVVVIGHSLLERGLTGEAEMEARSASSRPSVRRR